MARDQAYRNAELKIEEALRLGTKKLDLSARNKEESLKLTELPESLGHLTQLQSLNLSSNQLTQLPDWLNRLARLKTLLLSYNKLKELPESVAKLAQLRTLDLSRNQLARLPDWLNQLTGLQWLLLSDNELNELPDSIGELTKLEHLNLSGNELTTIQESISRLKLLESLDLSGNNLTSLPESIGALTELEVLELNGNKLTSLPRSLGKFRKLKQLNLFSNHLEFLPEWLGELGALETLDTGNNAISVLPDSLANCRHLSWLNLGDTAADESPLRNLPKVIRSFSELTYLSADSCALISLPPWLGELKWLRTLNLVGNRLTDLPESIGQLKLLGTLKLDRNPLNPELAAAYAEGLDSVGRYLRAKTQAQVKLNEAKLILIGEGEVGKSCLLGALRDDPWVDGSPTTHGIEIKPVEVTAPGTGTKITLNGWDFGGQRVYRPTHQLFFTAPAIYLVVWKPREGPQQGFVKEWITLVKHRAPDAKIIVVATHGGPRQRQPDIDRQEIWDHFGKDMVVDFFLVDSKPDKATGTRKGIAELKQTIARVAASLPEMGRKIPQRWDETRQALVKTGAAYLPLQQVLTLCQKHKMGEEEANDFVRISHRLGHLIHYEHDPLLQDIVVLKPDWLSKAISFALDDEQTRKAHGLVSFARLGQLWDDPNRPNDRYPAGLHPVFLALMERYDLSYRVAEPHQGQPDDTSLIAQLVPDVRPPEAELNTVWPSGLTPGDEQQVQICRIVDAKTGQSGTAEGLFFRLIVRLHKYSLGRLNRDQSVHWQRGLVLDDNYNGRALLENVRNDVRITVRAQFPEGLLSVITHEVKWLVEYFWKGPRCEVTVPCIVPCGKGRPGTGLFEVEKLITFRRQGMQLFPCLVTDCSQAQDIDGLLRNSPAARRTSIETLLGDVAKNADEIILRLHTVNNQLTQLNENDRRIISQVEDAYTGLMQALTDEAKEGPRLFSFEPADRRLFDKPKWVSAKFRLTLWCERSRLPLPALNGENDPRGIYEMDLPRQWVVKSMPYLKLLSGLLSLVVPVAAAGTKLELDDTAYKSIEKQLEFGQKGLESALKGGEKVEDWASEGDAPRLEEGNAIRARGAVLRQLHAWLKEKDPSFGGLVRVQNRRQEFLWVHPKFETEY